MGSGKSSVGREIAKTLGMNFVDTDVSIEQSEGIKISEMFEKHEYVFFYIG